MSTHSTKEYNRNWRIKNPEKVKIHWRKSYQINKIQRRKIALERYYQLYRKGELKYKDKTEYRKRYYENHKISILKVNKKWRFLNKDKVKQMLIDYKKNNPRLIKMYHQCRKYRKKNGGELSLERIQMVYEDNIKQYGTLTCYLCKNPIEFGKDHLEHKIPLSREGTNEYSNLGISCQTCNCRKHNKTEIEFREGRN